MARQKVQGSGFSVRNSQCQVETRAENRGLHTEYSVLGTPPPAEPLTLNPEPFDLEPERYELREAPRYHFDLDRRDVLKALGGGVMVCLVTASSHAQQRGGRGKGGGFGGGPSGPTQIGGYLHIAEDGQITLYCGKTEVGQNVRTSVTQAIAEELRVDPSVIKT